LQSLVAGWAPDGTPVLKAWQSLQEPLPGEPAATPDMQHRNILRMQSNENPIAAAIQMQPRCSMSAA